MLVFQGYLLHLFMADVPLLHIFFYHFFLRLGWPGLAFNDQPLSQKNENGCVSPLDKKRSIGSRGFIVDPLAA